MDGHVQRRRAAGQDQGPGRGAGRRSAERHGRASATPAGRPTARPTTRNAHPHTAGRVTLVHNGIIENFAELRDALKAKGRTFESETDTEVIAALIDSELATGKPPVDGPEGGARPAQRRLRHRRADRRRGRADHGRPQGQPAGRRLWRGRDVPGLRRPGRRPVHQPRSPIWRRATTSPSTTRARRSSTSTGKPVKRAGRTVAASAALVEKGNYRHFMEKEIHDQPEGCQRTIAAYVDTLTDRTAMPGRRRLRRARPHPDRRLRHLLYRRPDRQISDRAAGRPAGGRRDRLGVPLPRAGAAAPGSLAIAMSQSGETADTLAALRYCQAKGHEDRRRGQRHRNRPWPARSTWSGRSTAGRRSASPPPRPSPPRSAC